MGGGRVEVTITEATNVREGEGEAEGKHDTVGEGLEDEVRGSREVHDGAGTKGGGRTGNGSTDRGGGGVRVGEGKVNRGRTSLGEHALGVGKCSRQALKGGQAGRKKERIYFSRPV